MGEPLETLSPTLIFSSFTTPAPGDGISIVALSDSSVMSDCSFDTLSPGLTSTSMTSTSLKSPMSGTGTVMVPPAAEGFAASTFGAACAFGSGGASPLLLSSSTRIGEPFDTLSPTLILISFTTPAFGDGISMVALSDSSVTSDCSLDTASPGFTRTSMTSTSLKSPISGTSTWLIGHLYQKANPPLAFGSLPPLTGGRQECGSYGGGVSLFRIDAVLLDGIRHGLELAFAVIRQRFQS